MRADRLPALGVVVAALLVPAWFGARLYEGMDAARFRRVVQGVVALAGVAMIASALRAGG
jgi:uncharacterized membrane protein YfcA